MPSTKPKKEGTPAQSAPHPCFNLLESTVGEVAHSLGPQHPENDSKNYNTNNYNDDERASAHVSCWCKDIDSSYHSRYIYILTEW